MREFLESLTSNLSSISQASSIFLAFLTLWLTIIILKFTAKPHIKISFNGKRTFWEAELVVLSFHLRNVGHWYGRPPASEVVAWVNTDEDLEPKRLRFGSTLEKEKTEVRRGKGNSKCLKAEGIVLFYEEPGEDIELAVTMPAKPGRYRVWISLHSTQGGYTVYKTKVKVRSKPKREQSPTLGPTVSESTETATREALHSENVILGPNEPRDERQ